MTQAQLDAQIEQSLAAANAAIAAGATVKGIGGNASRNDRIASPTAMSTIALQDGKKIAVPQEGLRGNADGTRDDRLFRRAAGGAGPGRRRLQLAAPTGQRVTPS